MRACLGRSCFLLFTDMRVVLISSRSRQESKNGSRYLHLFLNGQVFETCDSVLNSGAVFMCWIYCWCFPDGVHSSKRLKNVLSEVLYTSLVGSEITISHRENNNTYSFEADKSKFTRSFETPAKQQNRYGRRLHHNDTEPCKQPQRQTVAPRQLKEF